MRKGFWVTLFLEIRRLPKRAHGQTLRQHLRQSWLLTKDAMATWTRKKPALFVIDNISGLTPFSIWAMNSRASNPYLDYVRVHITNNSFVVNNDKGIQVKVIILGGGNSEADPSIKSSEAMLRLNDLFSDQGKLIRGDAKIIDVTVDDPNFEFSLTYPEPLGNQEAQQLPALRFLTLAKARALSIVGLRVGVLTIQAAKTRATIVSCDIGRLDVATDAKADLTLYNSRGGEFLLEPRSCAFLKIERCFIGVIKTPAIVDAASNPFMGNVEFVRNKFSTNPADGHHRGARDFTALREHLEKLGFTQQAHTIRAAEMETEGYSDVGVTWMFNRLYGATANYGLSPGRSLLWLIFFFCIAADLYLFDGGVVIGSEDAFVGWRSALLPVCDASAIWRALLMAVQGIGGPLSLLMPKTLIGPATFWGQIISVVHPLISSALWLVFFICLRRRFKISG